MYTQVEHPLDLILESESQGEILHLTKSIQAAALTLFLYDCVLNFDREVVLVWRQPFGRRTFLFLLNRYLGGVTLIASCSVFFAIPQKASDGFLAPKDASSYLNSIWLSHFWPSRCRNFIAFQAWMTAFSVWTTQGLLQFRCHAFNHFHKGIITALSLIFGLEVCAMIVMLGIASKTDGDVDIGGPMCFVTNVRNYLYTFTIPILPFECLLVALTFSGALRHRKEMRAVMRDWTPGASSTITLRDVLCSSVATCIGYSIAGAVWLHSPSSLEIPFNVILVVNVIITSRMFLNLRELTQKYNPEDLPGRMTWGEDIEMESILVFSEHGA